MTNVVDQNLGSGLIRSGFAIVSKVRSELGIYHSVLAPQKVAVRI
jgi:hypothetical protein